MIITKFNSYFDKHGKVTYLVLCIIIAVIFVFTIGSGDSGCSGPERLTSIGSMYGHNLAVEDVQRKMGQIRLWYAVNNQRLPGNVGDFEMIQMVLEKMRLVKEAEERKLDQITDEDMAETLVGLPYWQSSDKDHSGNELDSTETGYSQARFKRFLSGVVKDRFGLTGEDFDEMMRDSILERRVLEDAVKDIKADEKAVKLVAGNSTLQTATFPMNLERDSRPSEAEIDGFMKSRSQEFTSKDKMENYFLIAYRDYDELFGDTRFAKTVKASEAEVSAYFKANAAKLYKGKKLADVKAEVEKAASLPKLKKFVSEKMGAFVAELKKPVPAKISWYAHFQALASKNGLKIARQNGVPTGSFVNGIMMQQKALVAALKQVKAVNVPTAVTKLEGEKDVNGLAVAMKVDNPAKTAHLRDVAADILRGEKALVMFQERIAKPYGKAANGMKSLEEMIQKQLAQHKTDSMNNPASFVKLVDDMDRLTNIIYPFFEEKDGKVVLRNPDKADSALLAWYKRTVALEKAKARAEGALKAVQVGLKGGKSLAQADTDKRFQAVKNPVTWYKAMETAMQMTYQQMMMTRKPMTPMVQNSIMSYSFSMAANQMGISVKNLPALIVDLDKVGDGTLLSQAYPTSTGYALVYQVKRALPTGKDGDQQVKMATSMIENEMKSKAVNKLKADLEADSNTRLVEAVMPQRADAEK